MLTARGITYVHSDKTVLFQNVSLSINRRDKTALIGNNGTGKSTLLKIMAGLLKPAEGAVTGDPKPYYVPQHFGQYDGMTVAQALGIDDILKAMDAVGRGQASETDFLLLDDDWNIRERCGHALSAWGLRTISLETQMHALSGGEKTRIFLAGIDVRKAETVLLDEPTNHLDGSGRSALNDFVVSFPGALLAVSHDRSLLRLLDPVYELDRRGISLYGGNYDFYADRKAEEENTLTVKMEEKEKELTKAVRTKNEAMERKQRRDARGRGKQEKSRVPRVMMKKMKNRAEASSARLAETHSDKISAITEELKAAQEQLPDIRKMKMDFESSPLHSGKILAEAEDINFTYGDGPLWEKSLNFRILSGERISITGPNGSGKTTLIRMILGELPPSSGVLKCPATRSIYIDQDYSLIDNRLTVYQQAQKFNDSGLEEYEVKIRLNRYLFPAESWNKRCGDLSGGEKMRLSLCCLMIGNRAPDLFILDEPTNNLDLQNIGILASAVRDYSGTLLVISHDRSFLEDVGVGREIILEKKN